MLIDSLKKFFGFYSNKDKVFIKILRSLDFFEDFNDEQLYYLSKKFNLKKYTKGEYIIKSGEKPTKLGLVESGEIKGNFKINDVNIELEDITRGDLFLEIAYFNNTYTMANLYTQNGVLVWEISFSDFDDILSTYPSLKNKLKEKVERRNKLNAQVLQKIISKNRNNYSDTSELNMGDLSSFIDEKKEENSKENELDLDYEELKDIKIKI